MWKSLVKLFWFILQVIPSYFFFFVWKSLVNFFRNFKLESDFFSTFFLQNQKTRKLCTFIYLKLQLSQFSAKSAKKKIFRNFKNLIGFFSDFFLQNHKTRKFSTFIYVELQLSQFSVKSETKKFSLSLHFHSHFTFNLTDD